MMRLYDAGTPPRFQIQNFGHKDFEPSKNEKSLPPMAFFLFTFIRGIFALYESLGQNINDPIWPIAKKYFFTQKTMVSLYFALISQTKQK